MCGYNEEMLRVDGQMQIGKNLWLLLFGTISHRTTKKGAEKRVVF